MFDRFEFGRRDKQEEAWACACDWCGCEIYEHGELFAADGAGLVCEDCFDGWQQRYKDACRNETDGGLG